MRSQEEMAEMRTRATEVGEQLAADPSFVQLAKTGQTAEMKKRAVEAGLPAETEVTTATNQFCFKMWGVRVCIPF